MLLLLLCAEDRLEYSNPAFLKILGLLYEHLHGQLREIDMDRMPTSIIIFNLQKFSTFAKLKQKYILHFRDLKITKIYPSQFSPKKKRIFTFFRFSIFAPNIAIKDFLMLIFGEKMIHLE